MIKRIGKAKKSKQGAMLIFVVLILALAIIFISAAMMLTNATRSRLYESTMTTQARLTCTSAVEVFLEALETQEITDEQLAGNIKTYHGTDKIRLVVDGPTLPGLAATGDDNCTLLDLYYPDVSNHNIVNADFTTTIGDETESIRVVLTVDNSGPNYGNRFKNQIEVGSNVLTETMRFYNGVGMWDPSKEKPTDNTILLRGHGTDSGGGGVFYSDVVFAPGQQSHWGSKNKFAGNVIFLDDAHFYSSHGDVTYSGDLYFIGTTHNNAGFIFGGNDRANQYDNKWFTNSKFVFLNRQVQESTLDTEDDDAKYVENVITATGKSCYFVTQDADAAAMPESSNPYNIAFKATTNSNSKKLHGTTPSYTVANSWSSTIDYSSPTADEKEINNNLKRYSASDFCNINKPFPSSISTVFSDFSADGYETATTDLTLDFDTYLKDGTPVPAGDTISAGTEYEQTPLTETFPSWLRTGRSPTGAIPSTFKFELSSSNLSNKATGNYVYLAPGYYYFTPSTDTDDMNGVKYHSGTDPYVIAIDGSKASSYRFYFQGNTVFKLGAVVFAVYNVTDKTTPICFILEPGCQIYFGGANFRETGNICNCGFISVQHIDENKNAYYSDASTMASWIRNNSYTTELSAWGGGYKGKEGKDILYPYAYDGVARPTIYIFGSGGCSMSIGDRCMIEAYVGLYGADSDGNKSTFGFTNCNLETDPIFIYGRVEANNYGIPSSTGAPGALCMPYCPQPGGVDNSEKTTGLAKSKYSVADLQYYRVLPVS